MTTQTTTTTTNNDSNEQRSALSWLQWAMARISDTRSGLRMLQHGDDFARAYTKSSDDAVQLLDELCDRVAYELAGDCDACPTK